MFNFLVLLCLTSKFYAVQAECASTSVAESFMSSKGALKMNELFLLGSHDAGTYGAPSNFVARYLVPQSFAQTQTKNLEEQLCAGYRVFDLRFTGSGADAAGWRIFHSFYLYETVTEIAVHITNFLSAHSSEVIILRTKFDAGHGRFDWQSTTDRKYAEEQAMMTTFATILGNTLVSKSVLDSGSGDFQSRILAQILSSSRGIDGATPYVAGMTGAALIMHYEGGGDGYIPAFAWQYANKKNNNFGNMVGKYSDSAAVTGGLSRNGILFGNGGQYDNFAKYKASLAAPAPGPVVCLTSGCLNLVPTMFGWWMTITLKVPPGDILAATKHKLFDNGVYGYWYKNLINYFVNNNPGRGCSGITVWTDFGGDEGLNIAADLVLVNDNILAKVAHNQALVAAPSRIIVREMVVDALSGVTVPELSMYNNPFSVAPAPPAPEAQIFKDSNRHVANKKKKKQSYLKKGKAHVKKISHMMMMSGWTEPLSWCEGPEDDKIEYNDDIPLADYSKIHCASDHAFFMTDDEIYDDDYDCTFEALTDMLNLNLLCNICDSTGAVTTPKELFDVVKEKCPSDAKALDQVAALGCCSFSD